MRINFGLRFRITLAAFLLVTTASGLFALGMAAINERLEGQLLYSAMEDEIEEYRRFHRVNPELAPPTSASLQSYLVEEAGIDSLPATLQDIPLGEQQKVRIDGRVYQAAHAGLEGRHLFITYDTTKIENRERRFRRLLIVCVILVSLLSLAAGYWLSGLALSPVTRLARRVSNLPPEKRGASLGADFTGYEVGLIAEAFDRYIKRLDDFIIREREFTERASHELRNPIAVIEGAAEVLAAQGGLPESAKPPLQRIRRASRQMAELTQVLLLLAREDEAHRGLDVRCDVHEILNEIVDSHRHLLAGRPVQLELDKSGACTVPARDMAVSITVGNLLRNAIEHTEGGRIEVELADCRLSIRDTGRGMTAEQTGRIFERGYRGPGSTGQGLGLHIVKEICNRYGWRIEVASTPGEGTVFTLTF